MIKRDFLTALGNGAFVSKAHPRIALRGALDLLAAEFLEAEALCRGQGGEAGHFFADSLSEAGRLLMAILGAELSEKPLAPFTLFGLAPEAIRAEIHHPEKTFGAAHAPPGADAGPVALRLNLLRARVRQTELAALPTGRADIASALNTLSSALYWLYRKALVWDSERAGE
ncbi:MAG: hypothetical protein LBR16_05305 [Treponema sp.]|nr:hypothetical protein [Treponema sp.]